MVGRELQAERRQADGLVAALTFIAVLVLLESLSVGPLAARQPQVAAALFWIALLFATILVTTRSFERELEDDALDALTILDGGREALFAGKIATLTLMLAVVAAGGGLLSILLLNLDVALPGHLAAIAALGVIALPPIVATDVAITLRLRARSALVPILALPTLVPQLLAATQGTAAALHGDAIAASGWAVLLATVAFVYATLSLTIVPTAIE